MVEGNLVAEEEGLVGGHRLDHFGGHRVRAALQLLHQFGDAGQTGLARQGQQPALDQILLVGRQVETGTLLQELAQELVVHEVHERSPENRRTSFGAIWLSGRIGGADARICSRSRHAPDHAGGLVLGNDTSSGRDDLLAAAHAVRPHAGEDHGHDGALPDVDRRHEQRVDRGFAEIDRRSVIERDLRIHAMFHDAHVAAARREIDLARLDRLAVHGLVGGTSARARRDVRPGWS